MKPTKSKIPVIPISEFQKQQDERDKKIMTWEQMKDRRAFRIGIIKLGKVKKPVWFYIWPDKVYGTEGETNRVDTGMVYFNIQRRDFTSYIYTKLKPIVEKHMMFERYKDYQFMRGSSSLRFQTFKFMKVSYTFDEESAKQMKKDGYRFHYNDSINAFIDSLHEDSHFKMKMTSEEAIEKNKEVLARWMARKL